MNCSRCRRPLKNDPHLHCGGCYEELLQRANGIVRENNDLRKISNGLRGHNDNLMVGVTMTNPTSAERALQIVAWLKSEFGLSLANDLDQRTVEAAIVRQLDHHARKSIRDTLALVNDDPAAGRVNTPEEAAAWLAKNVRADLAAEVARLRKACETTEHEVQQILGKALGFPGFKDEQANFPGATEADGVCVGDHVAATLATMAAREMERLRASLDQAHTYIARLQESS